MPGSNFDTMQNSLFETVKNQFGFSAIWTASDSSETWEGLVLFRNPTQVAELAGFGQFDPTIWEMEYKFGDFPGLRELVDGRNTEEVVEIDGTEYYVRAIATVFDGRTIKATLQPL
jgi:hypothetical protein